MELEPGILLGAQLPLWLDLIMDYLEGISEWRLIKPLQQGSHLPQGSRCHKAELGEMASPLQNVRKKYQRNPM